MMSATLTVHTTQFKSHQYDASSTMIKPINAMPAPLTVHTTQFNSHQHDIRTLNNPLTLFFVPMTFHLQRPRRQEQFINFFAEPGSAHGPDQRTLQFLATTAIVYTFVVSRSLYGHLQRVLSLAVNCFSDTTAIVYTFVVNEILTTGAADLLSSQLYHRSIKIPNRSTKTSCSRSIQPSGLSH